MNAKQDHKSRPPDFIVLFLYIFSFWGFVIAQPIYSDLFNDGGFFRWYQNTLTDIGIALLLISFLLPGIIILLLWLLSRLFPTLARKLCYALIALLIGGFCLLFINDQPDIPYLQKGAIGLICGGLLTKLLFRSKEREFLLYFFTAGALIFPFWFWVACPLTSPFHANLSAIRSSKQADTTPRIPIVMVVFDELPLTSLLDNQGKIDAVHYPNFAALAQNATWYPNAVTVHSITRGAVPAILTGQYPETHLQWSSLLAGRYEYSCKNPLPTAKTYPDTLFSLLEKDYTLQVYESRVYLCNLPSCHQHTLVQPNRQRMGNMFNRIAEEYFFRILFNSKDLYQLDTRLVHTNTETQAAESPVSHAYDVELFQHLVKTIHPADTHTEKPTLYFIHPILPHSPWEYYPSGKRYPAWVPNHESNDVLCEQSPSLLYCKNSSVSAPLYKRHLLQVGYADTLLGQVISKLKETQLYNRSLIVVVADHGISFTPYNYRRKIGDNNYADIMSIPLLIKAPGQVAGKRDEQQAETIDILPTMAGLLHIPIMWHTDGRDLAKPVHVDRTSHSICSPQTKLNFSIEQIQAGKQQALQIKQTLR